LDQWEISIYSEVPEVFAISNEVPRTSSLLPPLATPLLHLLHPCRRCQHHFPGHVLRLGRSPAPPPVPSFSTHRPQPERRSSFPSLALLRARHAVPRLCRRHLAAAVASPVHAPSLSLFWFQSSTSSLSFHSILVPALYLPRTSSTTAAISSNSGALLFAAEPPPRAFHCPTQPLGSFLVPH
jgi:hypothetical protein